MKRQIRLWPAVVMMLVALAVGLIGGGVLGAVGGYSYGNRQQGTTARAASTTSATVTPTANGSSANTAAPASTQSVDQIVAKVNPAVVTVVNHLSGDNGSGTSGTGFGTGMIIDQAGHIVTNNHVVDGAGSLSVIFSDGKQVSATLVGADALQDVAVIKVDGPVPATVTFGDSSQVQPGEQVIAIGSALGEFHNTVTTGIASARGRSLDAGDGSRLENLIQHDAPINPGNSGGPLLDMQGQVIGMNTALVQGNGGGFGQPSATGLGFAIESNVVKSYAEQLIANGKIARPYLGVGFRPASPAGGSSAEAQPEPVLIVNVAAGSPADKAGLQPGDVITAVDGTTLDSDHPFINVMYQHKPGDTVSVTIEQNDGSTQTLQVTLGTQPAS